jgi:hypothetical protein
MSDTKTKEQHMIDFIKQFAQYEHAMEPYKEGKKDLRKSFKDNNYLTSADMAQAVRAYRSIEKGIDLNETQQIKETLEKELGVSE